MGDESLVPVIPEPLIGRYRETLDQFEAQCFALALMTLQGANRSFPIELVLAELDRVAWTGPALGFKLAVLDANGREEVVSTATAGTGGGRLRGRVFRPFVRVLNAALGSLTGVPGVGAIKELKDFVEGARGE